MPAFHTRAAIVSIGDELVLGQSLDTNSRWLADRLMSMGVLSIEHVTIADDQQQTAETFARLASTASLIISTGGLGPTMDDLTRQAVAQLLGEELVIDQTALDALKARFEARGRKMSDVQKIQACRPPSARMIPNAWGSAPGLRASIRGIERDELSGLGSAGSGGADVFCLPGPPGEMKPMFETHVVPLIRLDSSRRVLTRLVHLTGIGEGDAAAKLGDVMERTRNPLVGITVSGSVLTCRVRYEGSLAEDAARAEVDQTVRRIRDRLGAYIFGEGDDTLAAAVLRDLKAKQRTLATVESCTAGLLAASITEVPGASAVFTGGLLTYSNDLKQRLADVPAELLKAQGAVSAQTAQAMARGGLARTGASNCVAITGIAGPDGGTEQKPVGTVYIAHAWTVDSGEPRTDVRRFLISGTRDDIRRRSVTAALAMLRLALVRDDPATQRLLWEVVSP